MPTRTSVNDSGTWRQIAQIHVNDSGTWRQLKAAYVNDSGTWRQVHAGDVVTLGSNRTITATRAFGDAADANASVFLENPLSFGTGRSFVLEQRNGSNTDTGIDWVTPANNYVNYECRATVTAGTTPTFGAVGTWEDLAFEMLWYNDRQYTGFSFIDEGTTTSTLLLEIRRKSDSVVVTSASYTLEATITP